MKIFKENSVSCAVIKVLKTSVVENNSVTFITGKIQGISTENFKSKSFHFDGTQENACDFVIHDIASKRIQIAILNDSCMEQKFKRGETLGLYTVDSSENDNLIQNSLLNIQARFQHLR